MRFFRRLPYIPVPIAHLAGAGRYDDPAVDEALGVFVNAIGNHDPRMAHVYFDVSGIAGVGHWPDKADVIAKRIRQPVSIVSFTGPIAPPGN